MSLLHGDATVPTKKDDIKEFLDGISESLNQNNAGAIGTLSFHIYEPDANEENWAIEVEGQISGGQDNDGTEIWQDSELQDSYSGQTLKEAAEKLLSDYELYYS